MRKLFCLFFLFVTVFFSLPVHADSLVSTQALHFRCSKCSYTCAVGSFAWVDDTADMTCPKCGGKLGIYQGATFISGGGTTRGGGAGRDVPGFSVNNSPTISPDGYLRVSFPLIGYDSSFSSETYFATSDTFHHDVLNNFYYGDEFSSYGYFSPVYGISSAPSGTYYVYPDTYVGKVLYETSSLSFSLGIESPLSFTATGSPSLSLKVKSKSVSKEGYVTLRESIDVYFHSYSSSVTKQNSISITNNTFNGNIYVDNSDNLTYIYSDNSTTCIVYDNTTNQYITYDQTTNYYYYITPGGDPSDYPTPTPEPDPSPSPSPEPDPSPSPSPNPDPSSPLGVGDSQSFETYGETSISGSVSAKAGDYILATVSARSDIFIPDSMTVLKIGDYITASSGTKQAMSFAYEQVHEDGTYTYTFTQSSTGRMYLNLIVLSNIDGLKYSGKYHTSGNGTSSLSVPDKSSEDMLVWGCSAIVWPSVAPYGLWTTSPDDLTYVGLSTSTQARQANFIDSGSGSLSRTFTPANTSTDYVIDAVEIIPKTVEPDPTPTPDPGSDLEPTPTPAPGGGYDDTNLLDKLGLWFADVNLNLNLAIENLALTFNTAIENLSADFDVYIKDLSANFTAVIEELQLNFKLAIENLNLTIQNYFGGGSGGSGSDISTPETAEPSPTPEPTPPLLEEEESVDSFLVQWLRAVVEHIQELLDPVQAVGSVYSDFYSYLPVPWQSALLGVFALLLVFALWRIFHG